MTNRPPESYRSLRSALLGWVGIALLGLGMAGSLVQSPSLALQLLGPGLLFGFLMWSVFIAPSVSVKSDSVVIRNIFRSHRIPLSAIERIDTKWALTLYTRHGKYSAFSAPAPGRHAGLLASKDQGEHLPESSYLAGTIRPGDLVTSDSGTVAAVIRRNWEQVAFDEEAKPTTTWHSAQLMLLSVLLGLTLASL
jgi:hypothetical protein